MNELVKRLSTGKHPVEAVLIPDRTIDAFKACLDRGYVHVKFTETRGGTELGMRLDSSRTDLSDADFAAGKGTVRIAGALTLNYVPVSVIATLDLSDLAGEGWLELQSACAA